ncbi:serine/threonine-protein kinase VRK3 [Aplochiton taeniatus]
MHLNFCPQCGTKLQTGFRFCPSCGEKLPDPIGPVDEAVSSVYQLKVTEGKSTVASTSSPASGPADQNSGGLISSTLSPVSSRQPLLRARVSAPLAQSVTPSATAASPKHPIDKSPRSVVSPRKRRAVSPKVKVKEEETAVVSPPTLTSPIARSPSTFKGKAKKAKHACAVEPLEEGVEVTDTTGRKWKLVKQLCKSETELIYGVLQIGPASKSNDYKHILKLGAKDGKIFNEQNFLQRAAKPSTVEKWRKHNQMDCLGIPSCVGFGIHADAHRFLILPNMGHTLQSIMEDGEEPLSLKAVLQLACRTLDVLAYIHENEYVHADINGENIYISSTEPTQVYLAGYCHAFRYCPGGRHVEYREGSRTLHEGAIEFISLDSHKGAGPSRRSDLQALGYCMLRWSAGALPWTPFTCTPTRVATEKCRYMDDIPGLVSQCFGQKKVSSALQSYLTDVMSLGYSDQPDYKALREGLCTALIQLGGSLEKPLDLQGGSTYAK